MLEHIAYQDFIPQVLETNRDFSTLCLSGPIAGPKYETFDALIARANIWLIQNPQARIFSAESFVIDGTYRHKVSENDHSSRTTIDKVTAFLRVLRVWVWWQSQWSEDDDVRPETLCYRDVLPRRLETTPEAVGPAYELLHDTLEHFNQSAGQGHARIHGRLVTMETCTYHLTPRNCTVDPSRTFWLSYATKEVHLYSFIRLYYIYGEDTLLHIGIKDFAPEYQGNLHKYPKADTLPTLTDRATRWLQSSPHVQLINAQTLDHRSYFRCLRDGLGDEKRLLASPYITYTCVDQVQHTQLLRLYFAHRTRVYTRMGRTRRLAHKTFHIPCVMESSKLYFDLTTDLLPHVLMDHVIGRIRQWMGSSGAHLLNIETTKIPVPVSRKTMCGDDCHASRRADRRNEYVYVIRVFVDNTVIAIPNRDLSPDPKNVKLTENSCNIL